MGSWNTATQLGGGVGLGVVATVVAATSAAGVTGFALHNGFLAGVGFSTLAVVLVLAGVRAPAARDRVGGLRRR